MTAYLRLIHKIVFDPMKREIEKLKIFIVKNEITDADIEEIEMIKNEFEVLFETIRRKK